MDSLAQPALISVGQVPRLSVAFLLIKGKQTSRGIRLTKTELDLTDYQGFPQTIFPHKAPVSHLWWRGWQMGQTWLRFQLISSHPICFSARGKNWLIIQKIERCPDSSVSFS